MINKKKVATASLLTALIITLVFTGLNLTSTVVAGSDEMTFDSDIEMTFETDNWTWMSTDEWIYFSVGAFNITFYNATDFPNTNITMLKNGCEYYADTKIEDGDCFYILAPPELYAWSFEVVNVTCVGDGYYSFNFNETYNIGGVANSTLPIELPGVENGTAARMVDLEPGLECVGLCSTAEGYDVPEEGSWYYFAWPGQAYATYGGCICSNVSEIYMVGSVKYYNFTMNMTFDYWYQINKTFTMIPPVDWIWGERMMSEIVPEIEYTAYVDNVDYIAPEAKSWWEIFYPSGYTRYRFHVKTSRSSYEEDGEEYWLVKVDEILDPEGNSMENLTLSFATDGIEAYELIPTLAAGDEYHISSPSCYLPEDVWFNITYPEDRNTTQFQVESSREEKGETYLTIGTVSGSNASAKLADYIKAVAPSAQVTTIGSGSWFNVKEGRTPDAPSCWNITEPNKLKGVTFLVDKSCENVFRIDEVLNQTGQPWNFTGLNLPSVTAEEFPPKMWIEPEFNDKTPGEPDNYLAVETNYTISIKTDYVFHIWSYEFTLEWNPAVLEGVKVENGDLITKDVDPDATFQPGTFDNDNGKLSMTGAYFDYTPPDPAPQTHGPGTLATVTFKVVGYGASDISLGSRVIGRTKDGYAYNAIDDITGELKDGILWVRLEGDVNFDGKVTGLDQIIVGIHLFEKLGDATWDPYADVSGDNKVTGLDQIIVGIHLFEKW